MGVPIRKARTSVRALLVLDHRLHPQGPPGSQRAAISRPSISSSSRGRTKTSKCLAASRISIDSRTAFSRSIVDHAVFHTRSRPTWCRSSRTRTSRGVRRRSKVACIARPSRGPSEACTCASATTSSTSFSRGRTTGDLGGRGGNDRSALAPRTRKRSAFYRRATASERPWPGCCPRRRGRRLVIARPQTGWQGTRGSRRMLPPTRFARPRTRARCRPTPAGPPPSGRCHPA